MKSMIKHKLYSVSRTEFLNDFERHDLHNHYKFIIFKPRFYKFVPKLSLFHNNKIKTVLKHFLLFFKYRSTYRIALCIHNDKIIASCVFNTSNYFFPFMRSDSVFLGPAITDKNFRRKSIMKNMIHFIINETNANIYYWAVKENNVASINFAISNKFQFERYIFRKNLRHQYHDNFKTRERVKTLFVDESPRYEPSKYIFKKKLNKSKAFLGRYTTNYDFPQDTGWYYVVMTKPINLDILSSNRRRKFRKGISKIQIKLLSFENSKEIYELYLKTAKSYKNYDILTEKDFFNKYNSELFENSLYGAYLSDSSILVGFAAIKEYDDFAKILIMKFDNDYYKDYITYGFFYNIINIYLVKKNFSFISNGERAILHETDIQDFLINQIGFNKLYSQLNITYKPLTHIFIFLSGLLRIEALLRGSKKASSLNALILQHRLMKQSQRICSMYSKKILEKGNVKHEI